MKDQFPIKERRTTDIQSAARPRTHPPKHAHTLKSIGNAAFDTLEGRRSMQNQSFVQTRHKARDRQVAGAEKSFRRQARFRNKKCPAFFDKLMAVLNVRNFSRVGKTNY